MRRFFVFAVALFAVGCSSHSGSVPNPAPNNISPNIFEKQPAPRSGWISTAIPPLESGKTMDTQAQTRDSHRNVWFVGADYPNGVNAITKIAMDQKVTSHQISVSGTSIADGSDQNLWITGLNDGIIARVTPTGVETDFSVTTPDESLSGITNGPDGALWFTECSNSNPSGIGRIDSAGSYSFYPVGCQNVVTGGSDGNIWYGNGANMYNMTPQGVFIGQYPVGLPNFNGVTTGTDGALWLVGGGVNNVDSQIIRVTMSGTVSKYPNPHTNHLLLSIAAAPDGILWMYDQSFTTKNLITFDPNSSTFGPLIKFAGEGGIILGPDGNIWQNEVRSIGVIHTYERLAMTLSPSSLTVSVGHTANFSVTETNYTGAWKAASSNPGVATVTRNSNNGKFVVTGVASGTTSVTVKDTMSNSAQVKVTVQ